MKSNTIVLLFIFIPNTFSAQLLEKIPNRYMVVWGVTIFLGDLGGGNDIYSEPMTSTDLDSCAQDDGEWRCKISIESIY